MYFRVHITYKSKIYDNNRTKYRRVINQIIIEKVPIMQENAIILSLKRLSQIKNIHYNNWNSY